MKPSSYSMRMKTIIFWIGCLLGTSSLQAQSSEKGFTYGEFKSGYGITQFGSGLAARYEAGNFSRSGGGLTTLAAYRKFEALNNLHFGLKFKALAAGPAQGDAGQEMFFNFWSVAVATKYFPFQADAKKGLFVSGDYNFVTQFTQKYRNTAALQFDHQFAIGSSLTLGLGYHFPLKNRYALVTSVEYDWAVRQGEVQGIGDVQFRNRHLAFQVGFLF